MTKATRNVVTLQCCRCRYELAGAFHDKPAFCPECGSFEIPARSDEVGVRRIRPSEWPVLVLTCGPTLVSGILVILFVVGISQTPAAPLLMIMFIPIFLGSLVVVSVPPLVWLLSSVPEKRRHRSVTWHFMVLIGSYMINAAIWVLTCAACFAAPSFLQ